MLGYAARAILSKTLQKILHKYLEDVDIQHLALWHSSSWSFEVSNVKLREGAQLMILPGCTKKTKKKRTCSPQRKNNERKPAYGKGDDQHSSRLFNQEQEPRKPKQKIHNLNSIDDTNDSSLDDATRDSLGLRDENLVRSTLEFEEGNKDSSSFFFSSKSHRRQKSQEQLEEEATNQAASAHIFRSCKTSASKMVHTTYSQDDLDMILDGNDKASKEKNYDEYSEDNEETEVEIQEDTIIQIGPGGLIGTLEVRLEGKDLQITIKDAELVVEAIPMKSSSPLSDKRQKNLATDKNPSGDDYHNQKNGNDMTEKNSFDNRDNKVDGGCTMWEKVTKQNKMAKWTSSLPQIFITDCVVHFIVRGQNSNEENSNNYEDEKNMNSSHSNMENDVAFMFGIDFLSITNGQDILAHTRVEEEQNKDIDENDSNDDSDDDFNLRSEQTCLSYRRMSSSLTDENSTTNDKNNVGTNNVLLNMPSNNSKYMTKLIRTGKGPQGGIWLKMFTPTENDQLFHRRKEQKPNLTYDIFPKEEHNFVSETKFYDHQWAWYLFRESSQMYLIRLSGIDIHAQILTEHFIEKESDAYGSNESPNEWLNSDELDNYTVDSTLFGFDYVAESSNMWNSNYNNYNFQYDTNEHGNLPPTVQVVPIRSSFFKLGQGMQKKICNCEHHPFDECNDCWTLQQKRECPSNEINIDYSDESQRNDSDKKQSKDEFIQKQSFNESMPLPGFILSISVADVIEINITQTYLESLAILIDFFKRKKSLNNGKKKLETSRQTKNMNNSTEYDSKTTSYIQFSSERNGKVESLDYISDSSSLNGINDEFPLIMQPEVTSVTGILVHSILIRLHKMSHLKVKNISPYSFSFWELNIASIAIDQQKISSQQINFVDTKAEIDELFFTSYDGAAQNQIFHLGPVSKEENDSRISDSARSNMQFSALSLLNIPVPNRFLKSPPHSAAVQIRWTKSPGTEETLPRNCLDINVGDFNLDASRKLKDEIFRTKEIAKKSLFRVEKTKANSRKQPDSANCRTSTMNSDSQKEEAQFKREGSNLLEYKICLNSIVASWDSNIRVKLPRTKFIGRKRDDLGNLMDACFSKLEFSYGNQDLAKDKETSKVNLKQFLDLPEIVRMRVFLYLDDLKPLQKALRMKKISDTFNGTHAFNKKLTTMSKKLAKTNLRQKHSKPQQLETTISNRRNFLIKKLSQLDDDQLENLFKMM